jgi:putative FmdB family regulatory protein
MPLYDYACERCGEFREFRRISERDARVPCPLCHAPAERMLTAPQLNLMPSHNRIAEKRNEKSAHEPNVVSSIGGAPTKPSATPKAHRHTQHPHRPWMLGH